ncbi:MAG: hypothetical protein R3B93_11160 [Bacteroidia bacterium]
MLLIQNERKTLRINHEKYIHSHNHNNLDPLLLQYRNQLETIDELTVNAYLHAGEYIWTRYHLEK